MHESEDQYLAPVIPIDTKRPGSWRVPNQRHRASEANRENVMRVNPEDISRYTSVALDAVKMLRGIRDSARNETDAYAAHTGLEIVRRALETKPE